MYLEEINSKLETQIIVGNAGDCRCVSTVSYCLVSMDPLIWSQSLMCGWLCCFAGCWHQCVWDGLPVGAWGRGSEVIDLSTEEEEAWGSVKSLICPEGMSSVCPTLPLLCDCDLHVLSTYLDTLVHILFMWFSNAMSRNEFVTFNEFNVWSWWERMNEWYHTNLFLPMISIICGSS